MNIKSQASLIGFALLIAMFFFIIVAFALIEPLKEQLDNSRNQTSMNCPGTTGFDQTDYDNDTEFERLVRRPTCFVTGLSMVWFIMSFILAVIVWVGSNWRRMRR